MYIRPEDEIDFRRPKSFAGDSEALFPPVVVLVVVLNSQERVSEDVYEGHSDGRTQPAVKLTLSAFSTLLNIVIFSPFQL